MDVKTATRRVWPPVDLTTCRVPSPRSNAHAGRHLAARPRSRQTQTRRIATLNDANDDECSGSDVRVFVVAKELGSNRPVSSRLSGSKLPDKTSHDQKLLLKDLEAFEVPHVLEKAQLAQSDASVRRHGPAFSPAGEQHLKSRRSCRARGITPRWIETLGDSAAGGDEEWLDLVAVE